MYNAGTHINEQRSAKAFTKQAPLFDALYSANPIIQYKRERVRGHLQQYLSPASNILELNSGTGEDAIFFAQQGHTVHATDISPGMQQILQKKIVDTGESRRITTEMRSFTDLENLERRGPYDLIFSNFAGLNCTGELDIVLRAFNPLLKPGGMVTLVMLPKFCLWETLLFFRGYGKAAFRRFFSRKGRQAHIEGEHFTCWYYNPSFIIQRMKKDFELVALEGLCTLVPPSYLVKFPEKYPRLYSFLKNREKKGSASWPWNHIGDYYIISFRKIS